MPTKPYDAASHTLYITTHDGITFAVEGEPEGDNFLATYDDDAVSTLSGAKGDVQFSQIVVSKGTVTKTMQWGSQTNNQFNKMLADQQRNLFPGKCELKRINDVENTLVMTCTRFMIVKAPDYGIGAAAANRGWSLALEKMKFPEVVDPA